MRRFLLISGLAAMLAASPLLANEKGPNRENRVGNGGPSVSGNLGATPTFDRRFGVVFDGSCSAVSPRATSTLSPASLTHASRTFIAGVPMKRATNRFAGRR